MSLLLTLIMTIGTMFCLPSNVINMRVQELIFPIIGITVFLSGMIFIYQSYTVGLFGLMMTVMIVTKFIPDSYKFLLAMTFFLIEYHLIVNYSAQIRKRRNLIYNMICIFTLVSVLWQVLQANNIMIYFYTLDTRHYTGVFSNRNETSIFMALAMPFFFRRKWCWLVPVVILGLYLSKTANGVIGASLVTSGWLVLRFVNHTILKRERLALVLVSILIPIALVGAYMKFVHQGDIGRRIAVFKEVLPLVADKPLTGWGIGQSQWIVPIYMGSDNLGYINLALNNIYYVDDLHRLFMEHKSSIPKETFTSGVVWMELHNDYLQFAIDVGILGLSLVILAIISHLWGFFKTRQRDILCFLSLIAILWTANAFFTFQIGRFTFLAVMFLAFIRSDYKDQERKIL